MNYFRAPFFLSLLALQLAACGGGRGDGSGRDAGPGGGSDTGMPGDDAAMPTGDATLPTADAGTCAPVTTGTRTSARCDWVRVGILEQTGAAPRVELRGRLTTGSSCAVLETIELTRGSTPIQVIDAAGIPVGLNDQNASWGIHVASADLVAPCSTEDDRLEPFGVIVRGSGDAGPFEARCGPGVEPSSGWPPRVFRTCHHGLERMPTDGNSLISTFTSTHGYFSVFHGPGAEVTAVSPDARVLAYSWMGAPIPSRATTGWMSSVSESMFLEEVASQVSLFHDEDPLGTEICPVSCDPVMDPSCDPNPVWLGRFSGTTARGPFRTEVLFTICTRPRPAMI